MKQSPGYRSPATALHTRAACAVALMAAVALLFALPGSNAAAAALPYEFDAAYSLRGNCTTPSYDPIPDPGCPGGDHPSGGDFSEPRAVAIDAYGFQYVVNHAFDGTAGRIDVFDDKGNFITELLDPHGPKAAAVDSKGNLYVYEQAGESEAEVALYEPTDYDPLLGDIEYDATKRKVLASKAATFAGGLAVDFTNDHLYVAYNFGHLEEFESAEDGNALLNTINLPTLENEGQPASPWWNSWVAVDGQRQRLYASYCKSGESKCGVLVLSADAPYTLIKELDGSNTPAGKFVTSKGWISTAVDESTGHFLVADLEASKNVYEFDEEFKYQGTTSYKGFEGTNALQIAVSNSPLNPAAATRRYLFVPLPRDPGAIFALKPPKAGPPSVESIAASNVSETEAQVRAVVDPNGAATGYVVEYVTQDQFVESEFANAKIAGAGTIPAGDLPTEIVATVIGLAPGTSYRFRVVANNGVPPAAEAQLAFRTYWDAPIGGGCANELLRVRFSALLPDCRAYELVTPADTNGRPPKGVGFGGDRFPTVEVSPSGNTVSFVTEGGSLPGTEGTGGFNGDLYRTSRSGSGWGNVIRTGPTGTETNNPSPGSTSADQEHALYWASGEGAAVVDGVQSHYVRYPDGRREFVGRGSLGTEPSAEGKWISEGGGHIIFQTRSVDTVPTRQLEPEAAPTGTDAVYDRTSDEVTHVVSLLPGDIPFKDTERATYLDASADGTGIAFSAEDTVYLRLNNEVTFEIGKNVTLADVSESGRRVFYVKGGDLFAFDTASEGVVRFTAVGNATVVNVAPGGSRAYFVSPSVIADAGANPNGATPVAGQRNLYLSEEGLVRFVGTVTSEDVDGDKDAEEGGLGSWIVHQAGQLGLDPSRVNPDGSVLLFESRANLDGYDPNGFPQIYRYDSMGNRLHCVSCPPLGALATGGASLETYSEAQTTPPPFTAFGFVPNLRADGKRAFFESDQALVQRDANDAQDIYQWEEQGVGSCTRPGGCVYLISSGHSTRDNYLYGVSRSGDDVFFVTEDVLVAGDNDTPSIYDARVGGGFPEPIRADCQGEGCRPPLAPPPVLTAPATPAKGADDNVKQRRSHCPRGKRKVKRNGKVRCVKKHRRRNHQKKSDKRKTGTQKGARR